MTGREQDRRRRRGEPAGGSPSRRTDRVRRPADRFAATATTDEPDATDQADHPEYDAVARRSTRGGRRSGRGPVISRALGRVLGRLTTRRAALLALVVCGLALSIAVPLHTYLSQRDDLAGQLHQQQVLRAQEKQLEQREQQLSDPAQIEAEARTRLHFVLPGETPYVVQLPGSVPPPAASPSKKSAGQSTSWYDALWSSISGSGG